MADGSTVPFQVTGHQLREIADRPDFGPTWSADFRATMSQLKADADGASLGEFFASARIPDLVAEGHDLVWAIRSACESAESLAHDRQDISVVAGLVGLRTVMRKLADALDDVAATASQRSGRRHHDEGSKASRTPSGESDLTLLPTSIRLPSGCHTSDSRLGHDVSPTRI